MNKIKFITDSTTDLPEAMLSEMDVDIVPLSVVFGEEIYSSLEITSNDLYKKVSETGKLPHTVAPPPALFGQHFKKWLDKNYDIFYVGIGSKYSATFQNAYLAAMDLPQDRIRLSDSGSLSSAIGLQLLKAHKLYKEGKNLQEIGYYVDGLAPYTHLQFTVKNMDYLYKGGRCNGLQYLMGTLVKAHPFVILKDGEMKLVSTPKGNIYKALDKVLQNLKEHVDYGIDSDHVMLTSSAANDYEQYLLKGASEFLDPQKVTLVHIGPICACHGGPGSIGFGFISTTLEQAPSEEH
jgi:DegV family protein with EDD domain